ncbi:hypothetical protein D3C85_1511000 [compost metagenome]
MPPAVSGPVSAKGSAFPADGFQHRAAMGSDLRARPSALFDLQGDKFAGDECIEVDGIDLACVRRIGAGMGAVADQHQRGQFVWAQHGVLLGERGAVAGDAGPRGSGGLRDGLWTIAAWHSRCNAS